MATDKEIVEGLIGELRRGTVVLAVLSQLKEPQYGYSLVQRFTDKGMPIETNTLYPLLRRLEAQGLLRSVWETDGAKPRKYYVRTAQGTDVYDRLKQKWNATVKTIATLIHEEDE